MRSFAYVEDEAGARIEAPGRAGGEPRSPGRAAQLFGEEELRGLRLLARRMAPAGIDGDDLLQDALERALRNIDRFEPGTNLRAWMRKILLRLAIDRVRERQRQRTDPADVTLLPDQRSEAGEDEPWDGLGFDDLRAAVDTLPPRLAATFRLWGFERLSYDEIGRRLGLPQGTVASRLMRARERLKKRLTERRDRQRAPLSFAAFARAREAVRRIPER
jgi:RNA polymerase sigma-70 factor (ECF subfamily)